MSKLSTTEKYIVVAVVISFLLKLTVMPIAVHADLFAAQMFSPLLLQKHVIDIYSYLDGLGFSYFYPPLTYYLFGTFQFILQGLSSTYLSWFDQMSLNYLHGLQGQAEAYLRAVHNPYILRDLFIAKIPYLIFDGASLLVLFKLAQKKLIQKKALVLWVLNLVIIYTTYLFGQFDIIVLFFILFGFFLLQRHTKLGVLVLGLAGALKAYPFMIVLPVVLIYGNSNKEKLKLLLIAFTPFVVSIIPVIINSPQLLLYTFFPKNIFYYKESLSEWQKYSQLIKYGSLALSYFLLLIFSAFINLKDKWRAAIGVSLVVFLLSLTLAGRTHFHYLIWEMPLMILWFRSNLKFLTITILVQTISFASYKLLANQLQLGLFAPLNPEYFSSLPTLNSIINHIIPYRIISTLGFMVFTMTNLFLVIRIFSNLVFKESVRKIV